MRIGTGEWGGRVIDAPRSSTTRPMSDKVRAALFSVLGDISGQVVLDLYAGSGAIGLEALSRGAAQVVLVEQSSSVAAIITKNIRELAAGDLARVINQPVEKWVMSASESKSDLIIADPPYAQIDNRVIDEASQLLNPGGTLVVSHSSKISSPELKSLELVQSKTYGDTALSFYKK